MTRPRDGAQGGHVRRRRHADDAVSGAALVRRTIVESRFQRDPSIHEAKPVVLSQSHGLRADRVGEEVEAVDGVGSAPRRHAVHVVRAQPARGDARDPAPEELRIPVEVTAEVGRAHSRRQRCGVLERTV